MKLYCIMYATHSNGFRYYAVSTVKQEYAKNEKMKGVDFYGNAKYCFQMIDKETAARLRKLKVSEWGIDFSK